MSRRCRGRGARLLFVLTVLTVISAAAGCSLFRYNAPPVTRADPAAALAGLSGEQAVVIGRFENPDHAPLRWADIGSGLGETLAGTLLNQGTLSVWIDPPLAREVATLIDKQPDRRRRGLEKIRRETDVRYVLTGKVTDFAHTTDLPDAVRRWGLFGRRREALVAIRLRVVDLETGRVVLTDHVYGTARAPATPSTELYANMTFGSYLFWNSPLGKASEEAIERASDVLHRKLPAPASALRIDRQVGPRELRLARPVERSDSRRRLFEVCVIGEDGRRRTLRDPDTGLVLTARLDSRGRRSSTAWLLGRKPATIDLRGAVLVPAPPEALNGAPAGAPVGTAATVAAGS